MEFGAGVSSLIFSPWNSPKLWAIGEPLTRKLEERRRSMEVVRILLSFWIGQAV